MAARAIHLRWPGHCSDCSVPLAAGELALWEITTHEVTCLDCAGHHHRPRHPSPDDRARVRALIQEARAALQAASHAS